MTWSTAYAHALAGLRAATATTATSSRRRAGTMTAWGAMPAAPRMPILIMGSSRHRVGDEREPGAVGRPAADVQGALPAEERVAVHRRRPVIGRDEPDLDVQVGRVALRPGWKADVGGPGPVRGQVREPVDGAAGHQPLDGPAGVRQ